MRRNHLILMLIATSLPGCASGPRDGLNQMWSNVPNMRWTNPLAEATPKKKTPDPKVSANIAAKDRDKDDLKSLEGKSDSKKKSEKTSDRNSSSIASRESEKPALTGKGTGIRKEIIDADASDRRVAAVSGTDDKASRDDVGRLKAALSKDAQRGKPDRNIAREQDQMRVRVDSLMAASRRQIEMGHLDEAQRAARLARDLSEHARLEFAPNEVRPIDILRQIDQEIELAKSTGRKPTARNLLEAAPGDNIELTSRSDRKGFASAVESSSEDFPRRKPTPVRTQDGWQTPEEAESGVVRANRGMKITPGPSTNSATGEELQQGATESPAEPVRDPFVLMEPEALPDAPGSPIKPVEEHRAVAKIEDALPATSNPINSPDSRTILAPPPPSLSIPGVNELLPQPVAPRPPGVNSVGTFEEMDFGDLSATNDTTKTVWSPFLVCGAGLLLLIGGVLAQFAFRKHPVVVVTPADAPPATGAEPATSVAQHPSAAENIPQAA